MMNSSKVIQYDVFISYRMKDGYEYASTLQRELEQQGFSVYLDDEDLGNGPFHGGVFLTIEKTPVFIAVLTSIRAVTP